MLGSDLVLELGVIYVYYKLKKKNKDRMFRAVSFYFSFLQPIYHSSVAPICKKSLEQSSIPVDVSVEIMPAHLPINPLAEHPQIGINPGCVVHAASQPPGHDSHLFVPVFVSLYPAEKRAAAVPLARVLRPITGTYKTPVQVELGAQERVSQRREAPAQRDQRKVDFLEGVLVGALFRTAPAPAARCALGVVAAEARRRQANDAHVFGESERGVEHEEGDVVGEGCWVVLGVDYHLGQTEGT